MTAWNPNAPEVLGPEFLATRDSAVTVLGVGLPIIHRFRSNSAETIAAARIHTAVVAAGGEAAYLLELTAPGDELGAVADFTTVTYAPNLLTVVAGVVDDGFGGPATVADIDEWPPVYSDYVAMGTNASVDLEFASAGFVPTGRVAAVALEVVTAWGTTAFGPSSDPSRRTSVSLVNGGTLYGTMVRIIPNNNAAGTTGRYLFSWGEINPITGQPWTQADITALDTGTTEIRLARQTGDGGAWAGAAVRLVVAYETTERRLARGVLTTPAAAVAGWTANIALASPAGAANWSKANATDYALVLRQADQGGLLPFGANNLALTTIHAAEGEIAPADLTTYDATSSTVTHLSDGNVTLTSQVATAETEVPGRLFPFVLRTTAPATSPDGQPYSEVDSPGIFSGAGATQQELTTTTAAVYSGLRLCAGWFPARPTSDLIVQVRRRSDSVLMGTFTVTAADVAAAMIGELILIETKAPQPGISLAAATQYYLDFTSATPSSAAWTVGLLAANGGTGGLTYQEATFAGGTDQADPIRGTASTALTYTPADVVAVLDAAVDEPAGFGLAPAIDALPDDQPCPLDGIPFMVCAWEPTVLVGDFARYELERLAPDGVTWQLIAAITSEASDGFYDYEARLGLPESYRVRVVRTDGASSYWSDVETETVPAAGCGYTFTSNEATTMSVGYPDVYAGLPTRTYEFPEADEVTFRRIYGRDNQVAFHPLSRRGVTFTRELVIGGYAAPAAGIGPPAVDMLRDLCWASIAYVCVRDQDGNRWFANVRAPSLAATRYDDVHILRAPVLVTEVTDTPSAPAEGVATPGGPLLFMSGEPIMFVDGTPMDAVS